MWVCVRVGRKDARSSGRVAPSNAPNPAPSIVEDKFAVLLGRGFVVVGWSAFGITGM